MILGAEFSSCRRYRYRLWRFWQEHPKVLTFLMLNPSTADESRDDPTIKKCIGWALNMGYGGVLILNIFAWRATDPKGLLISQEPSGGEKNNMAIWAGCSEFGPTVCAWGKLVKALKWREQEIANILKYKQLLCLQINDDGSPAHPLYLSSKIRPKPWSFNQLTSSKPGKRKVGNEQANIRSV